MKGFEAVCSETGEYAQVCETCFKKGSFERASEIKSFKKPVSCYECHCPINGVPQTTEELLGVLELPPIEGATKKDPLGGLSVEVFLSEMSEAFATGFTQGFRTQLTPIHKAVVILLCEKGLSYKEACFRVWEAFETAVKDSTVKAFGDLKDPYREDSEC